MKRVEQNESAMTRWPPVVLGSDFISSRPVWSKAHEKMSTAWPLAAARPASAS